MPWWKMKECFYNNAILVGYSDMLQRPTLLSIKHNIHSLFQVHSIQRLWEDYKDRTSLERAVPRSLSQVCHTYWNTEISDDTNLMISLVIYLCEFIVIKICNYYILGTMPVTDWTVVSIYPVAGWNCTRGWEIWIYSEFSVQLPWSKVHETGHYVHGGTWLPISLGGLLRN